LLETEYIIRARKEFEKAIDLEISRNIGLLNKMVDETLIYNGQLRKGDFISVTEEKQYKKLVKINSGDFFKKTGSGQRMQLILSLVKNSRKKYIFLDEPEKYSHPSMLNITAKIINDLNDNGKDIYIATHSPKLLSMLNISLNDIVVINDSSHIEKKLEFDTIINKLIKVLPIDNFGKKEKSYYDIKTCEENIKRINYREFLESLFTKQVYLCEGINDKLFLQKYLHDNARDFDDYFILPVYGKYLLPLFIELFKKLSIDVAVIFDFDNDQTPQKEINDFIISNVAKKYCFKVTLEKELGYTGDKSNSLAFYEYLENLTLNFEKYKL